MQNANTGQSSDVLQSYLAYLQEMSRKISLRSGMENTLYGKTKNNPSYYRSFQAAENDAQYFRNVRNYLEKESDRQLFLGNGLIVGSLKKNQARKYTAPLIYFLIRIEEEDPRTYSIEWDSASLNYDFITLMLEQEIEEVDEETATDFQRGGIDISKLEVLEDIETHLEEMLRSDPHQLRTDAVTTQIFDLMFPRIPELTLVTFSEQEFTPDRINNLRNDQGLTFYHHQFFYVANLPGQLSTYTALRKLMLEVR